MTEWNTFDLPPLNRQPSIYPPVRADMVTKSNNDIKQGIINNMKITIYGTEYGLYKPNTPNGGKRKSRRHHAKKRRTRKQ